MVSRLRSKQGPSRWSTSETVTFLTPMIICSFDVLFSVLSKQSVVCTVVLKWTHSSPSLSTTKWLLKNAKSNNCKSPFSIDEQVLKILPVTSSYNFLCNDNSRLPRVQYLEGPQNNWRGVTWWASAPFFCLVLSYYCFSFLHSLK